jgi:DNA-directed RNA polymerase subunit RPC12/RpoP
VENQDNKTIRRVPMSDLKEYKCPACGGAIEFDSRSQKMKCPYCDTEFDLDTLKAYEEQLSEEEKRKTASTEWKTNAGSQWQEGETAGMNVYTCKSCGGEIVADENTGASSCPYCGNPVIMTEKFSGALKPDLVIPFKLDKKAAKEAYYRHIKGRPLLPRVFRQENHIDEIKGVYVPFWLFDADVNADARYKATKIRVWSDKDYDYTETNYYSVFRSGNMSFASVPVDGSTKMADDLMESIEPFRIEEAVDFQTAYLAGYLADKYDVDARESTDRAQERMKISAQEVLRNTVKGYATVTQESTSLQVHGGEAKYALYPVWILNTTWKGKKYLFAMNGQTGKMTGDLPIDNGAYAKWLAGLTILCSAAAYLAVMLIY